jgi:hypothetical protein
VEGLIEVFAGALAALSAVATVLGAWAWWQVRPARSFWVVLRAAQALVIVVALLSGAAAALGDRPDDGLFWVYSLVPVLVSFVAEQLRAVSAQAVLDERDLEDAQAVGRLPAAEQHSIVTAILRREVGVMTLAAGVTCFMALRALGTAPGL